MGGTRKVNGTHRTLTLDQLSGLTDPLFSEAGITRVADITGLDVLGIPVSTAVRPNSRSLSVSQGKGSTPEQSRASAIMEALESHAAEVFRPPLTLGTQAELSHRGRDTVEVAALPRLPGAQDPSTRPLLWCDGTDLGTGAFCAVPFDIVHVDWTLPAGYGHDCLPADSNGLASGACLAEAMLHGLTELVERDAATLWEFETEEKQANARIDERTIDDAETHELLANLDRGRALAALWDLTCDTTIPVVFCQIVDIEADPFRPMPAAGGFGCHPDPVAAARRAITEAAQSRLIQIAGARDDQLSSEYRRCLDSHATERLRQRILSGGRHRPWSQSHAYQHGWHSDDVGKDLAEVHQRVYSVTRKSIISVEVTPRDWPIAVVKVLAPGLEGLPSSFGGVTAPGPRAQAKAKEAA